MSEEIDGYVEGTGRKGDCPTLTLVLVPGEDNMAFTWEIGSKVKVVRE